MNEIPGLMEQIVESRKTILAIEKLIELTEKGEVQEASIKQNIENILHEQTELNIRVRREVEEIISKLEEKGFGFAVQSIKDALNTA